MARRAVLATGVVGLALAWGAALADERSHQQAAEELLAAMKMDVNLFRWLEAEMAAGGSPPGVVEATREFHAKYVPWESIKPTVVAAYMASFSEAEIRGLARFYGTPVGRSCSTPSRH